MPLTADQRRRYSRQIRLADVGEAGQERLCDARVTLRASGPLAREIESAYLRATGMGILDGEGDRDRDGHVDLGIRHDIPRSIAEGALFALIAFTMSSNP